MRSTISRSWSKPSLRPVIGKLALLELHFSSRGERMEDAREARRKRLAERKTDRLAFITGQSSSPSLSAAQGVASTETPNHHHGDDIANMLAYSSNKQEPVSKPDTTRSHKHEIESEDQITANYASGEQKYEVASNEQKGEDIVGRLFTTSMLQKPAGHDRPRATNESQNIFSTIFTSRNIDHSVSTTSNLRLAFTLAVSILVVASYNGFIIGSMVLSSIVAFRPLVLVLLTDMTIILGSAFLKQGMDRRLINDTSKTTEMEKGWPSDLGRVFEIGMMLHKVLSTALMDCSICAVIVICGIAV